ncbi:MAG TPA: signal recognition particle-docking protein FtsY [Chthoniobacterales bacterium]
MSSFFKSILQKFSGKPVDWDDLEETLIRSDLGIPLTLKIVEALQARPEKITAEDVVTVARDEIKRILPYDSPPLRPLPNRPKVVLIAGVNGTGKTTSTAKLAHFLKSRRHSILLVAADTFRAAAIEQLEVWAGRIGVEMIKGHYNADPAALCHDAWQAASKRNIEFLLCDTAGRLHTKHNLMQELGKVKRTLAKLDPTAPHENWLVVDATTGSNAVQQAKEFHQILGLTGVIVTKLDGSGKGGVLVAIQNELGIPAKFIGTGEKLTDFEEFDARDFVERVL